MAVSKNTQVVVAAQHIAAAENKFSLLNKRMGGPLIWEREARFALQHVENSDMLQSSDPNTIKDAITNVAAMGLSLNPTTQQVALIPRWNRKKGMSDCTASPMYRGLIKLAYDAGAISSLQVDAIYEDDEYDLELGSNPNLVHKPNSLLLGEAARRVNLKNLEENKLMAVYCVATTEHGEKLITVMGLEEILKVANASDSFNPRKQGKYPSGPWVSWPEEMAKKSVIRRAQKTWPSGSNKYQEALDNAIHVMTQADVNDAVDPHGEDVVEGEATTIISEEEAKELRDLCRQQGMPVKQLYGLYKIDKMENLPLDKFAEVKTKLIQRLAAYEEKHGTAKASS